MTSRDDFSWMPRNSCTTSRWRASRGLLFLAQRVVALSCSQMLPLAWGFAAGKERKTKSMPPFGGNSMGGWGGFAGRGAGRGGAQGGAGHDGRAGREACAGRGALGGWGMMGALGGRGGAGRVGRVGRAGRAVRGGRRVLGGWGGAGGRGGAGLAHVVTMKQRASR